MSQWPFRSAVPQQVEQHDPVSGSLDLGSNVAPDKRVRRGAMQEHHRLTSAATAIGQSYAVEDDLTVQELGHSSDRKSTRLNSSHVAISYAVFCLKKKTKTHT